MRIVTINPATWYHIRLERNSVIGAYNLWVDGSLVVSGNTTITNGAGNVDISNSDNITVIFDDVSFYYNTM
jgi:hypothetical protein